MLKHFAHYRWGGGARERGGKPYLCAWPDIVPGRWWSTGWWRPPRPPLRRWERGRDRVASERWDLEEEEEERTAWKDTSGTTAVISQLWVGVLIQDAWTRYFPQFTKYSCEHLSWSRQSFHFSLDTIQFRYCNTQLQTTLKYAWTVTIVL